MTVRVEFMSLDQGSPKNKGPPPPVNCRHLQTIPDMTACQLTNLYSM